jgi:hypothetical protein
VADVFRRQRLGADCGSEPSGDDASAWDEEPEGDEPAPPPRKAWIFTSATLAVRQDFSHFQEALGLQDARCQAWSSPYDYPSQAMLYVPQTLPAPNAPAHTDAVVDAIQVELIPGFEDSRLAWGRQFPGFPLPLQTSAEPRGVDGSAGEAEMFAEQRGLAAAGFR